MNVEKVLFSHFFNNANSIFIGRYCQHNFV